MRDVVRYPMSIAVSIPVRFDLHGAGHGPGGSARTGALAVYSGRRPGGMAGKLAPVEVSVDGGDGGAGAPHRGRVGRARPSGFAPIEPEELDRIGHRADPFAGVLDRELLHGVRTRLERDAEAGVALVRAWNSALELYDCEGRSEAERDRWKYVRRVLRRHLMHRLCSKQLERLRDLRVIERRGRSDAESVAGVGDRAEGLDVIACEPGGVTIDEFAEGLAEPRVLVG